MRALSPHRRERVVSVVSSFRGAEHGEAIPESGGGVDRFWPEIVVKLAERQ
jgi:hypothetical protein